jgi:lipoprotein signal peptidase
MPRDHQSTTSQAGAASIGGPAAVAYLRADAEAEVHAVRHLPSYARFLSVAALGLALDLWSKHWAFQTMGQGSKPRVVIPHVLEFQTMLNSGALFGIGGGQTLLFIVASVCALLLVFWMFAQTSARRWALQIALGGILAGALGNMYDRVCVRLLENRWPIGGGVYMVRTGQDERGVVVQVYPPRASARTFPVPVSEMPREVGFVRDFIKIPTTLPRWSWIPPKVRGKELWPWVFNVADMLLVGGVGILAIHLWRDRKHPRHTKRNTVDSRASPA